MSRMRDEFLNESLFLDLNQVRQILPAWDTDYNTARPHMLVAYADHLIAAG
jgi:transposase InsO family protein